MKRIVPKCLKKIRFFMCALCTTLLLSLAGNTASLKNSAGFYENENGSMSIKVPQKTSSKATIGFSMHTTTPKNGDICDVDGTAVETKPGYFTFIHDNHAAEMCEITINIISYYQIEVSAPKGNCVAFCGPGGSPEGRYRRVLEDHTHD